MSPRGRRLAAALTVVAALLFAGRWLSLFLADRWWAETVSPAAVIVLTRRALLGLALDTIGLLGSALWFGANARAFGRTVTAIPALERSGSPVLRGILQGPEARGWLALGSLLLGVLIGSGLSEWTDTVMLARHGVTFGLADPAFGLDAGVYVSLLPLLIRLQALATVLVLTALGLTGFGSIVTGAVRIGRGRLAITAGARQHLGLLLGLLALVIGASQVLQPYQLAAGVPVEVAAGIAQLNRSVSMVLVGISLAVAMLSFIWAVRPVHSVVAGAWVALSATMVGSNYLLPDDAPHPADAAATRQRRLFESVAFALSPGPADSMSPLDASLWDATVVGRLARADTLVMPRASRSTMPAGPLFRAAWIVVVPGGPDSLVVRAIADDSAGAGGRLLEQRWGGASADTGAGGLARLSALAVRPGAPSVVTGSGGGVRLGGFARRLALAWALQAGRLVSADAGAAGWYLTPSERLRHLVPAAIWGAPRVWMRDGRLQWVLDGYATVDAFPLARRLTWQGRTVAYARAGLLGVIDAQTGTTELFLRPGADPLSRAWARASAGLVRETADLPPEARTLLGYPEELLTLQAQLLASDPASGSDSTTMLVATAGGRPVPGPLPGSFMLAVVDPQRGVIQAMVTGSRVGEADRLMVHRPDSASALEAPDVLLRRWQRFPFWQQLRDSITATGAVLEPGAVRYALTPEGFIAWQPAYAVRPDGGTRLMVVSVAHGQRLGMGRTFEAAWRNLRAESGGQVRLAADAAVLDEARRWVRAADSALRSGDLSAFGRAFGALRELLEGTPPK